MRCAQRKPNRAGALYECRSAMAEPPGFGELFCVTNRDLAARLRVLRDPDHQAVLFLPPPSKSRRGISSLAELERSLLQSIGVRDGEAHPRLRYSRVILCRAGEDDGWGWMEESLQKHVPILFLQYRVFGMMLPPPSKLTYSRLRNAVGGITAVRLLSPGGTW